MILQSAYLYVMILGVTAHLGYFIHGEHHREAPFIAILLPSAFVVLSLIKFLYFGSGFIMSVLLTSSIMGVFAASLFTSMTIYRVFFHPLRRFPGPGAAKISKFWHSYNVLPRLDGFRWLDKMYQEYGDFVRTGPNEIAIFDPAAVQIILGPGSRCIKGPFYDSTLPLTSLQSVREEHIHAKRRRVWDKGFGTKALHSYEERVLASSQYLVQAMTTNAGSVVDATKWFLWYSFDTMGSIAFNKPLDAMRTEKNHFALDILSGGVIAFSLLGPIPWLFCTLSRLPGSPFNQFVQWCGIMLEERIKAHSKTDVSDIMSNLIEDYNNSSTKEDDLGFLTGDTRLIVLAGTETTASALTYLFYFLAAHPDKQMLLRNELRPLIQQGHELNIKSLQQAPFLNGFINETLRLWPPVLSGLQYCTPPEGINIGTTFIPGNVTVFSPAYTVHRLESCFIRPDEFIPERWFLKPELIINKAGYAPFSLGRASCIGKQLALLELRTTVALLVTKFNITFPPANDKITIVDEVTDHFANTPGNLKLVFTPHEQAQS